MVNNEINAICSENQSDKSNLLKYESARIYIKFSRSNTIINLTDINGNSILCVSAGSLGFTVPGKLHYLQLKQQKWWQKQLN